jgi:hypothetical protein
MEYNILDFSAWKEEEFSQRMFSKLINGLDLYYKGVAETYGGVAMANKRHLKILKQGIEVWNQWRVKNPTIRPDLSRADLNGANLHKARLRAAYLTEADLREADISEAYLGGANLYGARLCIANLSGADLNGAKLGRTDFQRANLSEANLYAAIFREANLDGATLANARVGRTTFADLDLRNVRNIENVQHIAPSTIGTDTILRSRGKIPEAFLRGCGMSDDFISYAISLTNESTEYYSCFISYSTRDQAFAERLYNDLQGRGVRCWFAPEDMEGGKKIYDQVDQEIGLHDKTLVILSEHSIGSEWVKTEIRRTRKAGARDRRQKLFPIRLVDMDALKEWECFDADAGKDLAVEVREYFIPDFSAWKDHGAYQSASDRLLRDLKAEEG